MSNNATAFKENLRTLEKEVLKGDLDSFDQWIVYLNDNYGRMLEANRSNVNNEIATWSSVSDARYGMSSLQIAVWGGHPDMVRRVLDVCLYSEMPTKFDIEYRKKKNPSGVPNPEIDMFNGKTARGIADIMLSTAPTDEEKGRYTEILNILLNTGASAKYPRTSGIRGIQRFVDTVLPGVLSGGRRRTYRKKRKTNRRKTRRN
jgi:hypothetical protein